MADIAKQSKILTLLKVTESDALGCAEINEMVSEKLGRCWHTPRYHYKVPFVCSGMECTKCHQRNPHNPDYTLSMTEAWAIDGWLWKRNLYPYFCQELKNVLVATIHDAYDWQLPWASPLDRCKAFLLMDS